MRTLFSMASILIICLPLLNLAGCKRSGSITAQDNDIHISFSELRTKYGWNEELVVSGEDFEGAILVDGRRMAKGNFGFGNLKIAGTLLIVQYAPIKGEEVVLKRGSTLTYSPHGALLGVVLE